MDHKDYEIEEFFQKKYLKTIYERANMHKRNIRYLKKRICIELTSERQEVNSWKRLY